MLLLVSFFTLHHFLTFLSFLTAVSKIMAELQNQVKACIFNTEDFLAAFSEFDENDFEGFMKSSYREFLTRAWCELPVNNADGSALATVSCMPLWELLCETTSAANFSSAVKKGFAAQVLSAMYPKFKDRRCMFQQLNSCGSNGQSAIPLNTHIPLEVYVPDVSENESRREYSKALLQITKLARLGKYVDGKDGATVSTWMRHFINVLLPKCVLVDHSIGRPASNSNVIPVLLRDSGDSWNSGRFFLLALWCFLVVGEFLNLPETKELFAFLRSSRWASQIISVGEQKFSYSQILSPLTDISALCVALNTRSPSTAVDTVPLVNPRVLRLFCESVCGSPPATGDVLFFPVAKEQASLVECAASLADQKAGRVQEQLDDDIPNEIEFMGSSSSCRDFDQLAYLCRDLAFSPSAETLQSREKWQSRRRDLLFNRKRARGGNDIDGPCFIPVNSGLTNVMEKSSTESRVTLERLCCKWKKE